MIRQDKNVATTLDLFQILANQKRPIVWTFCLIMLVVIAVTFLGPKTYTSEAKLFVRLGRESVGLDPTTTAVTDQVVMVHESREYEINSVFELLKSRAVFANVVKAVGPEVVLGRGTVDDNVHTAGMSASLNLFAPYSIEDAAIKRLGKDLNIAVIKKSNVINLSYEAETPELARDVVATVIEQARDSHARVNRTEGSQDFFEVQSSQLREKVEGLEQALRDLKNSAGIANLPSQRELRLQQIANLQNTLLETEATLSASTAQMQSQQAALKRTPEIITTSQITGMPHSALDAMRDQFFSLQVREKELLSKYDAGHPLAVAMHQQVAALQAVIDKEPVKPQVAQGVNPVHQDVQLAYLKAESTVAARQAQAKILRVQISQAQQELTRLNNQEVDIARLEREIELETANYKKYSEHLEQARIDHELETQNISNLNVLQPPTYSITPTHPRRLLNLGLGLVGALASSLAVGLFLEERRSGFLNRWLRPLQSLPATLTSGRTERGVAENRWEDSIANGNGNGHGNGNGNGNGNGHGNGVTLEK